MAVGVRQTALRDSETDDAYNHLQGLVICVAIKILANVRGEKADGFDIHQNQPGGNWITLPGFMCLDSLDSSGLCGQQISVYHLRMVD